MIKIKPKLQHLCHDPDTGKVLKAIPQKTLPEQQKKINEI